MSRKFEERLERIIRADAEIEKIEASVAEDMKAVKETIRTRLIEREAVYDEFGKRYGSYGDPVAKDNGFHIYNVRVNSDHSVEFNWEDNWAYGGHDEGSMTLTKEEFVDGDFSALRKLLSAYNTQNGGTR